MDALDVLAACAEAGITLEPRGEKLGIVGPRAAVDAMEADIVAAKPELLMLLREERPDVCARCGEAVGRTSADGQGWCRRDDWRRYTLDFAALAGYPRLDLAPNIVLVVPPGSAAWGEFARHVAGATLYVALRHLRTRCGAAVEQVAPSESPLHPWQA